MLWMSWEDIRENLEDGIAEMEDYYRDDQTFLFENREAFVLLLHNALDKAIQKSNIEDIG